jgi:eukaryotic-like serine/threonine-protein kinase
VTGIWHGHGCRDRSKEAKLETEQGWKKIKELFGAALERDPSERAAFLNLACGTDVSLREEVESLIKAHESDSNLWQHPLPPQRSENTEGRFIGPYQLVRKIGEGGMGQVWLAQQTAPLQRKVALKLIRWGMYDDTLLYRFQAERQSLAVMDHPSIAKVFDAGSTPEGQPYFVMEYVPGVSITDYCDQKRLKVKERLGLFINVCEGVQHAHQKAIIHRDLKPANILVVEVNSKPVPRIIDFGLAKATNSGSGGESLHTKVGCFVGTPGYMSPEQCDPTTEDVDTRTDVYSLGMVLYVLLTGGLPFDATDWKKKPFDEMLRYVREQDPPRPSTKVSSDREGSSSAAAARGTEPAQLVSTLRGDLDWITMKTVEKDRTRRYAAPSDLAADLGRYLRNEPITARPASFSYRVRKFMRRNRTAVVLSAMIVLATIAGLVGTLLQARTARRQRDFALRQLDRAETINEFNEFMLSDAFPSDKPFTVKELLDYATNILDRRKDLGANRVELMAFVGFQYSLLGDPQQATRLSEQGYEMSRNLSEPEVRAVAACQFANVLAEGGGDLQRAEALYKRAMEELPAGPEFALYRQECLHLGSEVAMERGDTKEGISRIEAALGELDRMEFKWDWAEADTLLDLGEAYRAGGRSYQADAVFEKVNGLLTAMGRDETRTAAVLDNDWALALNAIGRPVDAEQLFRRSMSIQGTPAILLNNFAITLRTLGRLSEALNYAQRAYQIAVQSNDTFTDYRALYLESVIHIDQHDYEHATKALATLEPILLQRFPNESLYPALFASVQGLNESGKNHFYQALVFEDQAVKMIEHLIQTTGGLADILPGLLYRRATVELAGGQPAKAEADLNRAIGLVKATMPAGAFSIFLGTDYLKLGQALQSEGKLEEARSTFRSAVQQLEKTAGPDHPDLRSARELASRN